MERENIDYDECDLPMKISELNMTVQGSYRGLHSHPALEIVEVKSGELYCRINDETVIIRPDRLLFINSNTAHTLSSDNASIRYIQIDISVIRGNNAEGSSSAFYDFISHSRSISHIILEDNDEIKSIMNRIDSKLTDNDGCAKWYLKAYLYELVAFMYSKSFITPVLISPDQIKKARPIVEYIDKNFRSPLTLEDICSAAQYNKYTVCHFFKEITGGTVFEYINFLRIRYAVKNLMKKEISISQIANESGFSSDTYFNRVFKKTIGCPPTVYRKYLSENL